MSNQYRIEDFYFNAPYLECENEEVIWDEYDSTLIGFDCKIINDYNSKGWDNTYTDEENYSNYYPEDEDDDDSYLYYETNDEDDDEYLEEYGNNTDTDSYIALSKEMKRDRELSNQLKNKYNNICQICKHRLDLGNNDFYSETHHIHPRAEGGPDILENMIVVCRNCHQLFDRGAITIDLNSRRVFHVNSDNVLNNKSITLKHRIENKFVEYHNQKYKFNL